MRDHVHRHRRQRLVAPPISGAGRQRRSRPPSADDAAGQDTEALALAAYSLVAGAILFPLQTILSLDRGLLRFAYGADAIGIALLAVAGGLVWRGASIGLPLLAAAWGWVGADFWRASMERFAALGRGETFAGGRFALWAGPVVSGIAIVSVIVTVWIFSRNRSSSAPPSAS